MSTRPNEAQELYADDYIISYDGDEDAYEDWPEDYSSNPEEADDALAFSSDKPQRSIRRRKTARAKRRFFATTEVIAKNLRARYMEASSNPHSFNKSGILAADRLMKTAQKMGMDI